jgi:hypothetical protein
LIQAHLLGAMVDDLRAAGVSEVLLHEPVGLE